MREEEKMTCRNRNDAMRDKVLESIRTFTGKKGYPPTIRELCALVGLRSTSSVHYYIRALQAEGRLNSEMTKPRTLTVAGEMEKR
jgi:repressor LexA